jgi:hypothetical protein
MGHLARLGREIDCILEGSLKKGIQLLEYSLKIGRFLPDKHLIQ